MDLLLTNAIRDVADFPKPGIVFKDITPMLADAAAFHRSIDILANRHSGSGISQVVGIESRGFIFGAALAYAMNVGFVPVRKKGKLPSVCVSATYDLEYGSDCVEMHADALTAGTKVLVVDDVIATGGTLGAACRMVEGLGAEIVEVVTIIELTFLSGKEKLGARPFFSIIQY